MIMSYWNILSASIARQCRKPEGIKPETFDHYLYPVTLRNCSRNNRETGGIVIHVRPVKLTRDTGLIGWQNRTISRRLSPGYSEKRLQHAIARCVTEARALVLIGARRQVASDTVEARDIPEHDLDQACARFGDQGCYFSFDAATCDAVINWARQYPKKASAADLEDMRQEAEYLERMNRI